ncbi:hypothetical protein V6N13_135432 [Hibiscus sabdariffa]
MDIDLRLPSGEQCKEDEDANGIDNMLDGDEALHNGMVQVVGEDIHAEDGGEMHSSAVDMVTFKEDTNLEPLSGMEFESHGEAYSFYQEYARSMGFNTAIQNSRRSKTSREFIDAKFACSRYGTKRENDKSCNRPRSRQSKQDPENATGRRSCLKTDCKASMHVKRRPDGKWVIHSFVKEHNHELLPAQAVSEQTRRMYAAMARQFAEYKNVVGLKNDPKNPFDNKGRNLALEAGDVKILLEFFIHMQNINSNFFYAVDTWLKAMGGQSPRVLITDQARTLKSVVAEIFPNTHHCFFLWHVIGKVSENLGHVIKQHGNFMAKFEKCIHRSLTDEEFAKRWWKILDRFELKDDEWMKLLYEDRKMWVPTYIMNVLLAGMSTVQRSESVFFDKYVHKKTTVQDFLKHYEAILQDRYEEEAKANYDSWSKMPTLKSPSPFEKSVAGVYTHILFKKFQIEVVGAIACHPKQENHDSTCSIFRVQDLEKNQDFVVTLNEMKAEVSCICRSYEYKGYLCRHAMVVLQINGHSAIPSQYILKRWTKEAKSRHFMGEESEQVQSRAQRYNDLFQRAMKLIEEGSLSQESYYTAFRSLEEAFGNCLSANTSNKSLVVVEAVASPTQGMLCIEEDNQSRSTSKTNKKKNPTKKRKGNSEQEVMTVATTDGLQQMDKLSSRSVALDGYFSAQPGVQGMVQLNLMAPRDNYYGNQQAIQGLGQLNTIATSHDGYYGTQQTMPGMGPMDFFRSPSFYIRDDPNVRVTQLHDDASRHT